MVDGLSNYCESFEGVDAVILLTEWDEYKNIDWIEVSKKMRKPAWVFDSRSMFSPKDVIGAGLKLWRIGDGSIY